MKAKLTIVLALFTVAGHAANLLVNGSFEVPPLSSNEMSIRSGNTNLTGWVLGATGSLYLVRGPVAGEFSAADGLQYIDLNRTVSLSQSFGTVPNEIYEVRFSAGKFQGFTNMAVRAAILTETGTILTTVETAALATRGWNPPTVFRFVAASSISTLQFSETNSTVNYDLTLDGVSVERITPHLSIESSHVRICWGSHANETYQLQYRSELTTNVWTDLGSPIPGVEGTDCTVQPITEPRRFYRLVRTQLERLRVIAQCG